MESLQVQVAKELHYMFGFKATRNGKIYGSPAWKMVRAVTEAITTGLERDGKVQIPSFGTFTVAKVKAHIGTKGHWDGSKWTHYKGTMPEATRVYFRPSVALTRFVNEGIKDDGT